MDDISNLMALYTSAVEFYNCTGKPDQQKYYEQKLMKLVKSPEIMKIYDQVEVPKTEELQNDGVTVKIYDTSATSPLY